MPVHFKPKGRPDPSAWRTVADETFGSFDVLTRAPTVDDQAHDEALAIQALWARDDPAAADGINTRRRRLRVLGLIVDWRGVVDEDTGADVPYTPEALADILGMYPAAWSALSYATLPAWGIIPGDTLGKSKPTPANGS